MIDAEEASVKLKMQFHVDYLGLENGAVVHSNVCFQSDRRKRYGDSRRCDGCYAFILEIHVGIVT